MLKPILKTKLIKTPYLLVAPTVHSSIREPTEMDHLHVIFLDFTPGWVAGH